MSWSSLVLLFFFSTRLTAGSTLVMAVPPAEALIQSQQSTVQLCMVSFKTMVANSQFNFALPHVPVIPAASHKYFLLQYADNLNANKHADKRNRMTPIHHKHNCRNFGGLSGEQSTNACILAGTVWRARAHFTNASNTTMVLCYFGVPCSIPFYL